MNTFCCSTVLDTDSHIVGEGGRIGRRKGSTIVHLVVVTAARLGTDSQSPRREESA